MRPITIAIRLALAVSVAASSVALVSCVILTGAAWRERRMWPANADHAGSLAHVQGAPAAGLPCPPVAPDRSLGPGPGPSRTPRGALRSHLHTMSAAVRTMTHCSSGRHIAGRPHIRLSPLDPCLRCGQPFPTLFRALHPIVHNLFITFSWRPELRPISKAQGPISGDIGKVRFSRGKVRFSRNRISSEISLLGAPVTIELSACNKRNLRHILHAAPFSGRSVIPCPYSHDLQVLFSPFSASYLFSAKNAVCIYFLGLSPSYRLRKVGAGCNYWGKRLWGKDLRLFSISKG